jgi:hypothetical protein
MKDLIFKIAIALSFVLLSSKAFAQVEPCFELSNGKLWKVSCNGGSKYQGSPIEINVEDFDYNDKYLFIVKNGSLSRRGRKSGEMMEGGSNNSIEINVKKVKLSGDVLMITFKNGSSKRMQLN